MDLLNLRDYQRDVLRRLLAFGLPKGGNHTITAVGAGDYHLYIRPLLSGTAGYTDLTIQGDDDRLWLIENVSFIHTSAAARAVTIKHNSESEVIMHYLSATNSTYYLVHKELGRTDPFIVGRGSVLHLEITNLDDTKILQTHWVYREITDIKNLLKGE